MSVVRKMALLSIVAAIVTLGLKFGAWFLTGSVSLFSDAVESVVNLAAGLMLFWMLTIAARPADAGHAYGHDKAEYFSSGVEGALILVAAVSIIYAAVERFIHPEPLTHLGPGLLVSGLAALVNFVAARMLLEVAREKDSIALEADARHLLTDVWTSAGVLGGLVVVMIAPPAWQVLDPIMAVVVGANIVMTGVKLLRRSLDGLMDAALPEQETRFIEASIRAMLPSGASFHDLRSRKAGPRRFIELHLLVPGEISVRASHDLCDRIEEEIARELAQASVIIHVEPTETHSGDNS
ncbi:MAG: cation diffusion facilitator family transporter [Sulfuricella sp.]|jgi:divalent metal cation (Fe/Co/Zn/Cd) transporter